jgi:hypothetical protein
MVDRGAHQRYRLVAIATARHTSGRLQTMLGYTFSKAINPKSAPEQTS